MRVAKGLVKIKSTTSSQANVDSHNELNDIFQYLPALLMVYGAIFLLVYIRFSRTPKLNKKKLNQD